MSAIYLDHAATTPLRDEVVAAMAPFMRDVFGNPSSSHRWGRAASAALEEARAELAGAIGANRSEIRFVRGGTESDNLAILGSCRAARAAGSPPRLAVTRIEHSAVLEAAEHLAVSREAAVTRIDVAPDGTLDMDRIVEVTREGVATVSVMWANNETGLLLPVAEVTEVVAPHGATVHSDASQALGKVAVDVADVPVDLLTATGHKLTGPRGMGLLFVREGTPLSPLLHGGGQERGLRPGTEDVASAVGLATAVRLAVAEQASFSAHAQALRSRLENGLRHVLGEIRVHCGDGRRAPHISSIGVPGVGDGESLLMALDLEGVAVSGGSACQSGAGKGSHVIAALYGEDDRTASVRFSFGKATTEEDIDRAVSAMSTVVDRIRAAA